MKLNAFAIADLALLIGTPTLGLGAMIWASATPGNPIVGLVIGWAAMALWATMGSVAAYNRYFKKH